MFKKFHERCQKNSRERCVCKTPIQVTSENGSRPLMFEATDPVFRVLGNVASKKCVIDAFLRYEREKSPHWNFSKNEAKNKKSCTQTACTYKYIQCSLWRWIVCIRTLLITASILKKLRNGILCSLKNNVFILIRQRAACQKKIVGFIPLILFRDRVRCECPARDIC